MRAHVEGIERAVFGDVTVDDITSCLDRLIDAHLALHIQQVLFRSGRLAAVYGLQLTDSTKMVAKIHRTADIAHLTADMKCQQHLADSGYPCPLPLHGPVAYDGRMVVLETLVEGGAQGDAHCGTLRRAMARSLAHHMTILRTAPVTPTDLRAPPAWTRYELGPWPLPHDPIFDFKTTPPGYEWLDLLAGQAARTLLPRRQPDRIGHSDWACQNVRFTQGDVSAVYDWNSLIGESEPVLVGMAAGSFTEGSTTGSSAPTPDEVVAFLTDYEASHRRSFSKRDQATALAAATWVLVYNACCGVSAET